MGYAKQLTILFAASAIGAFWAFAWFGHHADSVMSKSGVGDVSAFEHYSRFAGFSFWSLAFFWIATVISTQLSQQPFRGHALFAFGLLMPIVFIVFYVGLLMS